MASAHAAIGAASTISGAFRNGVRQEAHRRRELCVPTSQHCPSDSRRLCISGYASPPLPISLDCTRPHAWQGQRAAIGPKSRVRGSGGLDFLTSTRSEHQRSGQRRIRRCMVITGAAKKTFKTFEELIEGSEQPVLVDWYADFCGPCHMMTPVLNEVGTQLKPHLKVVKIDTQKYPVLASKYGIRALPTLVLFKDGKIIDRVEGALNADQLLQRLRGHDRGMPDKFSAADSTKDNHKVLARAGSVDVYMEGQACASVHTYMLESGQVGQFQMIKTESHSDLLIEH